MRNAETILSIIQHRGKEGKPLEDLYRQLFNPDLYLRAYGRIYRNDGAMTRGVTQETVDGMSVKKIHGIIETLRFERYRWTPVRRTYIEKKHSTKKRPLGIPTWTDKLLQEVIRSLLEAYYEPQFSERSHGFRPGRGCHTALSEIQCVWHGTRWFIEGDIRGCFDNIDHQVLLGILSERIHDNRFLILIENLLKAGYLEDWKYRDNLSGTPQGGIVSPILANIYLDRFDQFVEHTLLPEFNRGKRRRNSHVYDNLLYRIRTLRAKGKVDEARQQVQVLRTLPANDPHDPNYRRLRYVRYADDFLLGFSGPRVEAEAIKSRIAEFLQSQLKLQLSEEKTLITHAKSRPARFLGYEIATRHCDTRRSLNGSIELRVPPEVIDTKCAQFSRHGKPTHLTDRLGDTDFAIVARYGQEYRGFVQYYALARNMFWLHRLHWYMRASLLKTLACRHRSSSTEMVRKYGSTCTTDDGKTLRCLEVVIERKDKAPLVARFGGISRSCNAARPVIRDVFYTPTRPDRSELENRLLANKCEICGSGDSIQVHHVRKLADLQPDPSGRAPFHAKIMAGRRRKTLIVCATCYAAIHEVHAPRTPPKG